MHNYRNFHVACYAVHNAQLLKAFWSRQTALAICYHKKRNVEAGLIWKVTWSVHYQVFSLEYAYFLTTNKISYRIDCSLPCVTKSCFYFCSVHVQQLSYWQSCTGGGLQILSLFIKLGHMLEKIENPRYVNDARHLTNFNTSKVLVTAFSAYIYTCINP